MTARAFATRRSRWADFDRIVDPSTMVGNPPRDLGLDNEHTRAPGHDS
jgi:hypothetical protein